MALLKQDRAEAVLGPHFAGLYQIVMGAWLEYLTEYKESQRQKHSPTTRAMIVHDLMVWRAARFVQDIDGARIQDLRGLKVLLFSFDNAMIVIRLKKLDDDLMPRNNVTQQVTDFRAQKPLQLDFVGPTHHLELGYVLDAFGQAIRQISMVCPNGPNTLWDIELQPQETASRVVEMFDPKPIEETHNIVRGKKTPEEAEEKDESGSPTDGKDK